MRSLIVIPTYNERENLPWLIPALLSKNPSLDALVVDDKPPDGTSELAEELA